MNSAVEEQPGSDRLGTLPYGLMSLWDMVNCNISSLCALCSQLMLEQLLRSDHSIALPNPDDQIGTSEKERIEGWLQIATSIANDFEWKAVNNRIKIIHERLNRGISNRNIAMELRVLRETINDGLKEQLIYRYRHDRADVLKNWKGDWASVLISFPSAQKDIIAGVDLWALGHSTASVFHFMRVLEHGLRALAKDVDLTFDVQNWQNIIDQIEAVIRTQGKTLPAGSTKSERLQFLSEAAKEFIYFKDGWRNYVSHNRAMYDEYQAQSVLTHVRSFMTGLAARLSETA